MKIENTGINSTSFNKTEGTHQVEKQNANQSADKSSSLSRKDKAELSDQARLMSKARSALDEVPDVDQAKVDDLKAKIQNGDYHVPIDKLADSMMSKLGLN